MSTEQKKSTTVEEAPLPTGDIIRRQQRLSTPMPLGFIYKTLDQNLESDRLMKDLLVFIPFIIVFVYFFLAQRHIEHEFHLAQGLRDHMYGQELPPTNPVPGSQVNGLPYFFKSYNEIGNEPEWFDYFEAILMPQMFPADPAEATATRSIIGQVYPVGSLRIRAKHVKNTSCVANEHVYPTDNEKEYPRPCYAKFDEKNEMKVPLGRGEIWWNYTDENCEGRDGYWASISGQYGTYNCGGFIVDIPSTTPLSEALKIARRMRNGGFGHVESVRALIIEMILYNTAINSFINVKLFTEVTEGGGYIPQQRFRPFRVSNNERDWIVYTVFFFAFVLYFWGKMVQDMARYYRMNRRIIAYFFDVWNLMEFVNNCTLIVLFVIYYYWWGLCDNMDVRIPARDELYNGTTEYVHNGDHNFNQPLNTIAEVFQVAVYLSSLNTVLLFLKIMKYLRLNNRLNILSRTMETVAQSILGVLVIFCWVVFAYTIAANQLYGSGIFEFRNTDESFAALFRILVGDFDYQRLREENRALTFVFFWSFVIIGLFILLNFVVAVVMNGFDEENAKQRPVPLDVVITEQFERMRKALREKGVIGILLDYILTSDDGKLHEFIGTYITTMKMTKEMDSANVASDDMAIEKEILEMPFRRKDVDRIMPKSEIEAMGEDKLDNLWCDVVIEFENTTLADEATKIAALKESVFTSSVDGVTRVLVNHQRKLFGHKVLSTDGKSATESQTQTPSSSRKSSFMSSSIRKQTDGSDMDFANWTDGSAMLEERQVLLKNGERANSTTDVIHDVEARVTAIEARFNKMSELAKVMEKKVEMLNTE